MADGTPNHAKRGAAIPAAGVTAHPGTAEERTKFPTGFLWGAATASYQVEGNNVATDLWPLETLKPTVFAEPSGDACNSFGLWGTDLDLLKSIGLGAYRFSLEWSRIEPEDGFFSRAMLDHYKAMILGCRDRGVVPIVTFNHCTTPRWFARRGGWTKADSASLFARFCQRAAHHLAAEIGYAATLNEPNGLIFAGMMMPPKVVADTRAMLKLAAEQAGSPTYRPGNVPLPEDIAVMSANLLRAHTMGRQAIKSARPDLPVGICLAVADDQAVGDNSKRDAVRQALYSPWLEIARDDDFIGVQNYERTRWSNHGKLPSPPDAVKGFSGGEIYPPSLGDAVRYVHQELKIPILVTENGVNTNDDAIRAAYIPEALRGLKQAIADGTPVLGYIHWSLMDNFEWVSGFNPRYGLCSVDRTTFARTPKPSAGVLGAIARANAV